MNAGDRTLPVEAQPRTVALLKQLPDFAPLARNGVSADDDVIANARAEAAAQAHAEALRERERLEEAFEARLAVERRAVAGEAGERLAAELAAAIDRIAQALDAEVARILTPIVDAAMRQRALDEFAQITAHLLREGLVQVEVRGAPPLLSALAERLGEARQGVRLIPVEGAELSLESGPTSITTRLQAWATEISALMAVAAPASSERAPS
jgi:hypothetical protein